jgi:hypothetical protein
MLNGNTPPRRWVVALVKQSVIQSVPRRSLSCREASAYAKSYNRYCDGCAAVVMRQPISRAISTARARSLSS